MSESSFGLRYAVSGKGCYCKQSRRGNSKHCFISVLAHSFAELSDVPCCVSLRGLPGAGRKVPHSFRQGRAVCETAVDVTHRACQLKAGHGGAEAGV